MARLAVALLIVMASFLLASFNTESAKAEETWCVARPGASDDVLKGLVFQLCNTGASTSRDFQAICAPVLPGNRCFQPNTATAHASFVINAAWQLHIASGQELPCDFGGIATLVTQDPSTSPECRYQGRRP